MNAKNFDEVFGTLIAQGISPEALFESVCKQVCHMHQLFPNHGSCCAVRSSAVQSITTSMSGHANLLHHTALDNMPIALVAKHACTFSSVLCNVDNCTHASLLNH